jgi:hypothetical protein
MTGRKAGKNMLVERKPNRSSFTRQHITSPLTNEPAEDVVE